MADHQRIFTAPFPLYAIRVLSPAVPKGTNSKNVHLCIALAGGGGDSRTGVKNGMIIATISSDALTLEVQCQDMSSTHAGMNVTVHSGGDVVYGTSEGIDAFKLSFQKPRRLSLKKLKDVTTTNKENGEQTVCKLNNAGSMLATGDLDGSVTFWQYPGLQRSRIKLEGHRSSIRALAFHPNDGILVTASADKFVAVWSCETGKREQLLCAPTSWRSSKLYTPRSLCFLNNCENGIGIQGSLVVAYNAPAKSCRIARFSGEEEWKMAASAALLMGDAITCMAASADGNHIGVGSAEGSVVVLTSSNLSVIRLVRGVHDIFITDVVFLPKAPATAKRRLGGKASSVSKNVTLLTVSADKWCCSISVPDAPSSNVLLPLLSLFLALIILLFAIWYANMK